MIHFAGLKAVGESVAKLWEYYDNNLNSTLVLIKAMKVSGVKNTIFSSAATVYTADNEMPLRETSRTGNCTNPYGWTRYIQRAAPTRITRYYPLQAGPAVLRACSAWIWALRIADRGLCWKNWTGSGTNRLWFPLCMCSSYGILGIKTRKPLETLAVFGMQ